MQLLIAFFMDVLFIWTVLALSPIDRGTNLASYLSRNSNGDGIYIRRVRCIDTFSEISLELRLETILEYGYSLTYIRDEG